jgi:hypothetical protein
MALSADMGVSLSLGTNLIDDVLKTPRGMVRSVAKPRTDGNLRAHHNPTSPSSKARGHPM